MMHNLAYTIVLLILFGFETNAQRPVRDIIVYKESININHITPEAIDSLEKINTKRFKSITFNKSANQADFNWVCDKFRGIKRIMIESSNDSIADISKIAQLDSLEELLALHLATSHDSPIDLAIISELTELTTINFNSTHVANTEALKNLHKLKNVGFYLSEVNAISFLYHTPLVEVLHLHGLSHSIENYEPVANLKELRELAIYMNPQATDTNLVVLKSLNTLRKIQMRSCFKVTTLDFLENNNHLEEIDAGWCSGLKDFSALANFKSLKKLSLDDTNIVDLSDLEGITTLVSVDFSYTDIKDISVLKNCTDLLYVNIEKTQVTDLSPLEKCTNLKRVRVSPNIPNLDQQIEKLIAINPSLEVRVRR
jgi:internalin A